MTATSVRPSDPLPLFASRGALQVLTAYIFFLYVLPSRVVYAPLGGIGRPEVLVALGGLVLWGADRFLPGHPQRGHQPIRVLLFTFMAAFLVAYLAGLDRRLPGIEARAMDRAMIAFVAFSAVTLIIVDDIRTRRDLDVFLRRMALGGGGFLGAIGALQFLGLDLAPYLRLPGLTYNASLYGIGERGSAGFSRVPSTAGHAVEFGVVASMLLPIALHYALHSVDRRGRRLRWTVVTLLCLSVPFSISRSSMVALIAVLVMLVPVWSGEMLKRVAIYGGAGVFVVQSAVPGLLGTMKSLFINAPNDNSVTGRTEDYGPVMDWVVDRPWFGRGPRTFLPDAYRLLDNQYLNTLVTTGMVGLAAMILLLFGAIMIARHTYLRGQDDCDRHLAQGLAGSVLAGVIASGTFDSLSFSMFTGTLFMIIGAIGALWRLERDGDRDSLYRTASFQILARSRERR